MKRKPSNWREKLHPVFFELAAVWRKATVGREANEKECRQALENLGPNPVRELAIKVLDHLKEENDKLQKWLVGKLTDIDERYRPLPESPLAYPWLQAARRVPLDSEREAVALLEWLHWERHGEPLGKTFEQANSGDLDALHKLQRTEEDAFRISHAKGPLKKFQGDAYHRDLLELGVCFGIEKLTSEELADCFEEYCTCGKEHDADALKKQRARLMREIQEASATAQRASRPQTVPKARKISESNSR